MILHDLMKAGAILAIQLDDVSEIRRTFDVTGSVTLADTPYGKGMVFGGSTWLDWKRRGSYTTGGATVMMLCEITAGAGDRYLFDARDAADTGSTYSIIGSAGAVSGQGTGYTNGVSSTAVTASTWTMLSFTTTAANTRWKKICFGSSYLASGTITATVAAIIVFPFQLTTADMLAVQAGITGYQRDIAHWWLGDTALPVDRVGAAELEAVGTITLADYRRGTACVTDASNYLKLAAEMPLSGDFTIAQTIRRTDSGRVGIIAQGSSAANRIIVTTTNFYVDIAGTGVGTAASVPQDSVLIVTRSGTTLTLYVNGKNPKAVTNAAFTADFPVRYIAHGYEVNIYYSPRFYDFRIYDRALSPLEVRHLHMSMEQQET